MSLRVHLMPDGTLSGVEHAPDLPPREKDVPRDVRYRSGLEALRRMREERASEKALAVATALEKARAAGPANNHVELEFVPISKIRRESLYNRDLDHDRALSYALDFKWPAFGAVVLNRWQDDTYDCIDGQHRIVAAELAHGADTAVPAVVNHLNHVSKAADAYDTINTHRVGLTFQSKLRGRMVAGQPQAQRLIALLEQFGLRPAISTHEIKKPQAGMVVALSTLNQLAVKCGWSLPTEVLGIIKAAHGDNPAAYRDYMLNGLAILLLRYHADDNYRRDRVVHALSRDLGTLAERAKKFQSGMETRRAQLWSQAIHYYYNLDLKTHRQLGDWRYLNISAWGRTSAGFNRAWRAAHEGAKDG